MKNKVMKKLVAFSLALTMVAGLTACGSSSDKKTSDDTASAKPSAAATSSAAADPGSVLKGKTISFLTCQGKYSDQYKTMADAIEKDYGCHVEFQVVPDDDYQSLLKVKLSTSEAPDVFEYNYPTQNADIGAAEYCEDLSNEAWVSRLVNPDLIKDANDGKFYALPKESSSAYMAVYYNKKVLESCGIKDPHPTTYDEFLSILQAVKEKGKGVIPFYETNADTWTTQIFMTAGYPVALGDKAKTTFDSLLANKTKWTDVPEFQDVLQKYLDLNKKGYVNKDNLSVGYDTAAEMLGTGKVATYLTIEQCAADVIAKYPDCQLGSFVIPFGNNDVMATGAYVQGLFVPKAGKQVDVAKAFLNVWSMSKYQNMYYATKPGFSAFNDVDGGKVPECVQSLVDNYIKTGKYVFQLNDQMPQCSTIWTDLWNYYVEAVSGQKSAADVFKTFQKQYVDFMNQQGVDGF
jgi:ABC-type sugar transport system, periplasmic component